MAEGIGSYAIVIQMLDPESAKPSADDTGPYRPLSQPNSHSDITAVNGGGQRHYAHSAGTLQFLVRPLETRGMSAVAMAATHGHRLAAAWRVAREINAQANQYLISGKPATWWIWTMLVAHDRNGPDAARLGRLECWRIVIDAMHTGASK